MTRSLLLFAALLLAAPAFAQSDLARLTPYAGTYSLDGEARQEAGTFDGSLTVTPILGGHFQQWDWTMTMRGDGFEEVALLRFIAGRDPVTGAYEVYRFDSRDADSPTVASHPGDPNQGTMAFDGATGRILGEPGRGLHVLRDVRTLLQLDGAIMAAGGMRAAVGRAVHQARYRESFGKTLIKHPLHARVLADLAIESAAHTALSMRIATAFDQAFERDGDHAVARLVTPAARVYTLMTGAAVTLAACEAMGGSAFDASHPAARLRADLTAMVQWDGTVNEAALDAAQLVERDNTILRDALEELAADLGNANTDLIEDTMELGERAAADPALARAFAEQLAMVAAASAMRRNLPRVVADAYIATRLRERFRAGYGTLDGRFDANAIIELIVPED